LAVSRPIMVMLIGGGSLIAGSNDPHFGTLMPFGGRPPHLSDSGFRSGAPVGPLVQAEPE